jgi:hypothetical protein
VTFGDDGKPIITPLGGSDVKKIAAGSMTPLQERQMHLQEYVAEPDYLKQLALQSNDITPITAKVDAVKMVGAGTAYQTDLNNGLNTYNQIGKILGSNRIGSELSSAWTKAMQGPNSGTLATYQKSIDAYNAVHPEAPINLAKDGLDAVNSKLQAESTKNLGNIAVNKNIATTQSPGAALQTSPTTATPQAPTTPAAQSNAQFKDGAIVNGIPVLSMEKARGLPKGTRFYGTNGQQYIKP